MLVLDEGVGMVLLSKVKQDLAEHSIYRHHSTSDRRAMTPTKPFRFLHTLLKDARLAHLPSFWGSKRNSRGNTFRW